MNTQIQEMNMHEIEEVNGGNPIVIAYWAGRAAGVAFGLIVGSSAAN